MERAREAHRLGAFDYMSKPVVADELLFRVERALEAFRLAEKALRLERRLKGDGLEAIVGDSPAMRDVFRLVEKIAPTQLDGPHPRRVRHRQGARRARDPRALAPRRAGRSSR